MNLSNQMLMSYVATKNAKYYPDKTFLKGRFAPGLFPGIRPTHEWISQELAGPRVKKRRARSCHQPQRD